MYRYLAIWMTHIVKGIMLLLMTLSVIFSSAQVTGRQTLIGVWDVIKKNPQDNTVTIRFIDSAMTLTVGDQQGVAIYKLDSFRNPMVLLTFDTLTKEKMEYEIRFSGQDTLIFISIHNIDQKVMQKYQLPTLVRRKDSSGGPSENPLNEGNSQGHASRSKSFSVSGNTSPTWSPDGQYITFVSSRDGNHEIYLMKKDGTDVKRLTHTIAIEDAPSFSPDGKKILFTSNRDGVSQVYVMNIDGSEQVNLTNSSTPEYSPKWISQTGDILFQSQRDPTAQIYVMKPDGSRKTRVTDLESNNSRAFSAPDGSQLICTSIQMPRIKNSLVWLKNDSISYPNITDDEHYMPWGFSPDGRKILFSQSVQYAPRGFSTDLFLYDLATRRHFKVDKNIDLFRGAVFMNDSTIIVSEQQGLVALDVKTKKVSKIFKGDIQELNCPPFEDIILFTSVINGKWDICIVRADGTGFQNLTAQNDITLYGYADSITFRQAEITPVFPGGPRAWKGYLAKNLYYSHDEIPKSIDNIVTVQFIVELDGKPTEVIVVKSVDPIKDKKAVSLIKNVIWVPAVENGQKVRYRTKVDIQFPPDTQ